MIVYAIQSFIFFFVCLFRCIPSKEETLLQTFQCNIIRKIEMNLSFLFMIFCLVSRACLVFRTLWFECTNSNSYSAVLCIKL